MVLDKQAQFRDQLSTLCAALGLLLLVGVMTPRLLRAPVYPFDEGIVLTHSDLWTRGYVPNRDFYSAYPPGNYWIVGLAFELFDPSVDVERAVGLAYRLILIASVFILCRPRGNFIAFIGASLSFLASTKDGLAAYAWVGASGFALASIAMLAVQTKMRAPRLRLFVSATAGLLAAMTLLLRTDIPGLGVLIASVVLIWNLNRFEKFAYGCGWFAGFAFMAVHACRVGFGKLLANLVVNPIFKVSPHRRMPLPPIDMEARFVFWVTMGCVALIVIAAAIRLIRPNRSAADRAFASVGLLTACWTPHALARADVAHLMYVGLLAFAFVPAAISSLLDSVYLRPRSIASQAVSCTLTIGLLLAGARCVIPFAQRSTDSFLHIVTLRNDPNAIVGNRGRTLPMYRQNDSRTAKYLIREIERLTKPGDHIFIGVGDLRYANMNDVDLYFLLPQLRPASFYIYLDPGLANAPDSPLPLEIAHADLLILNTDESDPAILDNGGAGSSGANDVVRKLFNLKTTIGPYELFVPATPTGKQDAEIE